MDNLIHTDKPNLIEDIFSYDQIPPEKQGRITAISDEELIEVCKQHLPKHFK